MSVDGTDARPGRPRPLERTSSRYRTAADLPGAGAARTVRLPDRAGRSVAVPGLPLTFGRVAASGAGRMSATTVRVRALPQSTVRRAAIAGPVFAIERTPSPQRARAAAPAQRVPITMPITIDYSSFEDAFGGGWGSRLRLELVPACRLGVTPGEDCGPAVPLATRRSGERLTASVPMASGQQRVLVAATAGPAGDAGDFRATPLPASSAWSQGLQAGDFTWSYPLPVVPVAGGLTPDLSVQYSSQSVDGRVLTSNGQTSWLGEGHDLSPGFIERGYTSCADRQPAGRRTGDLCWGRGDATLSFRGHTGALVRVGSTDEYRLQDDQGWRIRHLTASGLDNGDDDGEYWLVTDQDGTRYYFGRNRRFGDDSAETRSAWTVPVFGDDPGEPCHGATFADSWCSQAWRWNLDYVVDLHGNSISYFYDQETNRYGLDGDREQPSYVRGGHLDHIDYGQVAGTEDAVPAAARVVFATGERCIRGGRVECRADELDATTASHWPDVPSDQICTSTTSCGDRTAPTFFTRRRLESVTTQVRRADGYDSVDAFTFSSSFPSPEQAAGRSLWLDAISRRGLDGGTIDSPEVRFLPTSFVNRVPVDGEEPVRKQRIARITTETGEDVAVRYRVPDCRPTRLPRPSANRRLCFPVLSSRTPGARPDLSWYYRRVVASVTRSDANGTVVPITTTYAYRGGAGWHSDGRLVAARDRTYGEWRGFRTVEVRTGNPSEQSTVPRVEQHTFFRGLDGDRLPGGRRRRESVSPGSGATLRDLPAYRGFQREHVLRDGPRGRVISAEVDTPKALVTATDADGQRAFLVRSAATATRRQRLAVSAYVRSTIRRMFDGYGMQLTEQNNGDDAITGDTSCTRTEYARDVDLWLLTPVRRQQESTGPCPSAVLAESSSAILSDTRYQYDGLGLGVAPTRGDRTVEQRLSGTVPNATWRTTATTEYDARGRVVASTDGLGHRSTVSFTPSGEGTDLGPVTEQTSTNAKGQSTTTTFGVGRGLPVRVVAVDGGVTSADYDALGRLTDVWRPGRAKGEVGPDVSYVYRLSPTTYSSVETRTRLADDTYVSSFSIYDAMLREVETQQPAADADTDRVVTTIAYDSKGQKVREAGPYAVVGSRPSGTYFAPVLAQVRDNHRFVYDGAGRLRVDVYQPKESPSAGWRTRTIYDADRTRVEPPAGGTPTTEVYDVRGHTIRVDRHLGRTTATSAVRRTRYAYDLAGRLTRMTDAGGDVWRWTYDLRGNRIAMSDPDRGSSRVSYDDADRPTTTVDARGRSLFTAYDELGRKVGLYDGASADRSRIRAAWEYDTVSPGRLTSSTRWATPGDDTTRFVSRIDGYNALGLPTGTTSTVPSTGITAGLGGSYSTTMSYDSVGALLTKTPVSVAGMTDETIRYYYDRLGRPARLGGAASIVIDSTYSPYGELLQTTSGTASGRFTYQTWFYDEGTRRLERNLVSNQATGTISDISYGYEDAGNVVRVADTAGTKDIQCFDHDPLGEMTEAWTIASGSCGTPSRALMSTTPGAYWSTYTYDRIGNRRTEVKHVKSGSDDTLVTYGYPTSGPNAATPGGSAAIGGPHAVTSISTAVGTGTPKTTKYEYDETGNMTTRGSQTLTWDSEGNLTRAVEGTNTITNLYDADGNRLVRHDGSTTTLYLDSTEIRRTTDSAGTKTTVGQRWYTFDGKVVATRAGSEISMLAADHHDTGTVQIDPWSGNYTKRRFDPFGRARKGAGTESAWSGDHGFLDKPTDANGLTQVGARYYDAAIGRFISVDPLLVPYDPAQTNPYSYAGNSPATYSDPTGTDREYFCSTCEGGGSTTGLDLGQGIGSGSSGSGDASYPPVVDPGQFPLRP
ncbi:hypothetical protein K8Z61_12395 [Nocardioides sp. TRM66260-LWL]|uniref:RHS repeat-associated core domain-containing protein n=1 Tax=Nocardioides sp. TRM66260-LWL TaxID=2874478 RepID=UPI001CC71A78|nr:RHS repeat-associated core domain-containing protein [Nocardioides sp. TRM66260-LWL]MBZ5735295.1 hypothetical protein [Nocardioides sp. TRM66260-LWL]